MSELCFETRFCNAGMKNRIMPLNAIIDPANTKPGVYEVEKSYKAPTIGGPTNVARPLNEIKISII